MTETEAVQRLRALRRELEVIKSRPTLRERRRIEEIAKEVNKLLTA